MEHISVLREDVQKYLKLREGMKVLDATLGLGGHSEEILEKIGKTGELFAFEQDKENLEEAKKRLKKYESQIVYFYDNFCTLKSRITGLGIHQVDVALFDLGLSSPHVDESNRGFSFMKEGPLDMRFDKRQKITAQEILNKWSESQLADVFYFYGEERRSKKLAKKICEKRKDKEFTNTVEFAEFVEKILLERRTKKKSVHPATKIFQALRIAVNDELNVLEDALKQIMEILSVRGRLVVISYHSLEDRIVKKFFKELERPKITSPEKALYQTADDPIIKILTKKPVIPTDKEIEQNFRSRSAKLRACEKIKSYIP